MRISARDFHAVIAVGSGFLLFGIAAGLGAIFCFRRSYRVVRHWKTAAATIVGYKLHSASPGARPVSVPEFQFLADNGKVVTGFADVGSKRKCFRVGATVIVLYPPDDPTKAQLKTFDALWATPVVLGFFGSVFLGIFVFLLIHLIIDRLAK